MYNRTIVVGDLQGCYQEAVALLEKCQVTNSDRVIFAGDLVDRGPDNDKCVDLARRHEQRQGSAACILGNHEDKHLSYRLKEEQGLDANCVIPTHIATRTQLKNEHYDYIKQLPLLIKLPEHNAVVVHAGVFPGRVIDEQTKSHLLHLQMINPPDETTKWPSKAPTGWKFWHHFWTGPERIIFGHTVFDNPLITSQAVGIDGGGCFGMRLHALILPEWKIVSINCKNNYGKGSRGREGVPIKKFFIDENVFTYS